MTDMTLKDLIRDDVPRVFLNTDDFAESVTYTPVGGAASSITALVFRQENTYVNETGDGNIEVWRANVHVGVTDVAMPLRGDKIVATGPDGNAETWKVDEIGAYTEGKWVLPCILHKAREVAGEGYRAGAR